MTGYHYVQRNKKEKFRSLKRRFNKLKNSVSNREHGIKYEIDECMIMCGKLMYARETRSSVNEARKGVDA